MALPRRQAGRLRRTVEPRGGGVILRRPPILSSCIPHGSAQCGLPAARTGGAPRIDTAQLGGDHRRRVCRMPAYVFAIISAGWFAWGVPFFLVNHGPSAERIDRRARWGILLEGIGFALVWQ